MSWIDNTLTGIPRDIAGQVAIGFAAATLLLVAVMVVCLAQANGPYDAGSTGDCS